MVLMLSWERGSGLFFGTDVELGAGVRSAGGGGDFGVGGAGSHEDERALGEWRVDEKGGAGQGESEIDVVQEEEGRKSPEDVERQEELPEPKEFFADAGRVEEESAEEKGANGDEDGGGDDEDGEGQRWFGEQRGEEVIDFGEIGEGTDVEGEIHDLEEKEEGLGDGVGDFGELFGRSQDMGAGRG